MVPSTEPIAARIGMNLRAVRAEIAAACSRCGRAPDTVRLIAVTKEQDPDVLAPLLAEDVRDVGENRLDHLARMHGAMSPGLAFHFIGRVQGRQLAKLLPYCAAIHSLCDEDHVVRLARASAELGRRPEVFLQVNTAFDAAKAGMTAAELPPRLDLARRQGLAVVGLMTMAPLAPTGGQAASEVIRRCFADLRALARQHGLPRLSMGMSHDFPIAIEEGATDVRIGTRLFA
jgi:pyridoxal phosphate enzyme (YggS family)